jgi:hypothetical protein
MIRPALLASLSLALVLSSMACGPTATEEPKPSAAEDPVAHEDHHGAPVALGRVDFGDEAYLVMREGDATPGEESAILITPLQEGPLPGLYVWIEDAKGEQISVPMGGDAEDGGLHFHFLPRPGSSPQDLVVRRREGGEDDRRRLSLMMGAAPQRDGVLVALNGGIWAELKLHDDVGNLELWLYRDAQGSEPADLPLDRVVELRFVEPEPRRLRLAPRDTTRNADESGAAQIRAGKTNYFIFPGNTGADTAWMSGLDFRGLASLHLPEPSEEASALFALHPHAHDHDH